MDVFLIRHAEAVDETLDLRDPMRHLTAAGRAQATHLGDRLRWHDCAPTQIWTSPLVRAVQTAELVATAVQSTLVVEVLPDLGPEGTLRHVADAVQKLPPDARVMLFGHEPSLSGIGALLTGSTDFPPLDKAEAVRVSDGVLRWRFAWDADAPTTSR